MERNSYSEKAIFSGNFMRGEDEEFFKQKRLKENN